jgi:hypothetical protein
MSPGRAVGRDAPIVCVAWVVPGDAAAAFAAVLLGPAASLTGAIALAATVATGGVRSVKDARATAVSCDGLSATRETFTCGAKVRAGVTVQPREN